MRTQTPTTDIKHPPVHTPDDHHPEPGSFSINNTSQSLPPGTDYNLDIPLGKTGYKSARIILHGPVTLSGNLWRESAIICASDDPAEALGVTTFNSSWLLNYTPVYSKAVGNSYLTDKIFDNNTTSYAMYIALKDAYITGSNLRLVFHNFSGGSATLWVKGQAIVR